VVHRVRYAIFSGLIFRELPVGNERRYGRPISPVKMSDTAIYKFDLTHLFHCT